MPQNSTNKQLRPMVIELEKEIEQLNTLESAKLKGSIFFKTILDGIIIGVWVTDKNDVIYYTNKGMEIIAGIPAEQIKGANVLQDFPESTVKFFRPCYQKAKNTLQPQYYEAIAVTTPAGRQSYQSGWLIPRIREGGFDGMICTVEDVSERKLAEDELNKSRDELDKIVQERTAELRISNDHLKQEIEERTCAEKALREKERFLGAVFDSIQDGISVLDPELTIVSVNQTMRKWYAHRLPLEGKKCYEAFYGCSKACKVCPTLRALETGRLEMSEVELKQEDAVTGTLELFAFPMLDESGKPTGVVEYVRNISDRKRAKEEKKQLEARLQQASKMEAIATLAGGIAHKFNNSLSVITGNIELLEMETPDSEMITGYLEPIKDTTLRMTQLTNQLLAYAKGGKYRPKTISLSDLVRDILPQVKHTLAPSISVETDLPYDIFSVKADLTQLQTVISAILSNASEAIEGGGRIRISCRNEAVSKEVAGDFPGLKPGTYAVLSIEDNGKGMDAETRGRVFEPFFSTKFEGRGLGLAATYGIVKNHDGYIAVDSALGKGTMVRMYLPAVNARTAVSKKPVTDACSKTKTVLVIEDEETVLEINRAILEKLGYRVLRARTGQEAVDIAKTFDGDIDAALLDIILPDMEGQVLYPLLMEARPNLKVILCTGFAVDGIVQELLNSGAQAFVHKPLTMADVSEKLQWVLEQNKTAQI